MQSNKCHFLKFQIVFIITGFSNKPVRQVVLINHRWISSTLQMGWGGRSIYSQRKNKRRAGGVNFPTKKGVVGKIVEGGYLGRASYDCCLSLQL